MVSACANHTELCRIMGGRGNTFTLTLSINGVIVVRKREIERDMNELSYSYNTQVSPHFLGLPKCV